MLIQNGIAAGTFTQQPGMALLATEGSTSATFGVPATVLPGDLLVLFDVASNAAGLPSPVVPTGWTNAAATFVGTFNTTALSFRIAQAGDESATFTGMTGGAAMFKTVSVVRGGAPFDEAVAANNSFITSQGSIATSLLSQSNASGWPTVQVAGYYTGAHTVSFGSYGFSPTEDNNVVGFGQAPMTLRYLDEERFLYSDVAISLTDASPSGPSIVVNALLYADIKLRFAGYPRIAP